MALTSNILVTPAHSMAICHPGPCISQAQWLYPGIENHRGTQLDQSNVMMESIVTKIVNIRVIFKKNKNKNKINQLLII